MTARGVLLFGLLALRKKRCVWQAYRFNFSLTQLMGGRPVKEFRTISSIEVDGEANRRGAESLTLDVHGAHGDVLSHTVELLDFGLSWSLRATSFDRFAGDCHDQP